MATPARVQKLAEALSEEGYDAYFASTPISMGYLHGFPEDGHERFLTLAIRATGEVALICPALSEQQARRRGIIDTRPWRDGEDPLALFGILADEWNLRSSILAVDDQMQAQVLLKMQSVLPAALFKPGQEVLSRLMRNKDPRELELMREAARIADEAFPEGLKALCPGATENDVAKALSEAMNKRGGKTKFSIIAAGANGAEPHHLSDDTIIKEGDVVVMDFGCEYNGYQSDITRTVCCGQASDEAKHVYRTVWEAHTRAREAIKPGATCGSIDEAARRVIEQAGYGQYFVHRTGHGIGMQGHEEPYIVGGSDEPLTVGNCFSVEPGIYLPGNLGVRIENIVTVSADGHESLNEEPSRELLEV